MRSHGDGAAFAAFNLHFSEESRQLGDAPGLRHGMSLLMYEARQQDRSASDRPPTPSNCSPASIPAIAARDFRTQAVGVQRLRFRTAMHRNSFQPTAPACDRGIGKSVRLGDDHRAGFQPLPGLAIFPFVP